MKITIGWVAFSIALPALFWKGLGGVVPQDSLLLLLVAVPIFEETVKFVAYRNMKGFTVLIPIAFILAEFVKQMTDQVSLYSSLSYPMILAALLTQFIVLKHILFWIPQRLWGFSLWTLPLAIAGHFLWNLFVILDAPEDGPIIEMLALFTFPLALLLMKEKASPK